MFDNIVKLWNEYYYVFWDGLLGTLWLSTISVFFATILGSLLAFAKLSKIKILDIFVNLFMWIIRGTPILLQLYFFWLLLPKIVPFTLSDSNCIIIALIVNASSYVSEVVRAGIQGVDTGQAEASKSLGLTTFNTYRKIIIPQALKNILPALGNQYIMMVKQTSLASVFFISELMTSYKAVQSATFLAIPSLTIAGIIYLLITAVLTKALDLLERRLKRNDADQTTTVKKAYFQFGKPLNKSRRIKQKV